MTTGDLERERLSTGNGSPLAMITVIARYEDGSPVRGEISCSGNWFKHEDGDPQFSGPALPFRTDSRGAVILNPHLDDAWIVCWCEQDGQSGKVLVSFDDVPTGVYEMVMGAT